MVIRVAPDEANPTHHVSLSDGTNEVGLIVVDKSGNASPMAISGASTIRTAIKTTSGNTKYSDFEQPWAPIAQEDWSGGRGLDDFDDNVTRFSDSKRCNTLFGNIMLGPQDNYTNGYRNANYSLPGNLAWKQLLTGENQYLAVKFIPAVTYTAKYIYLHLRRRGTPGTLTIGLYTSVASVPDTLLQSATVTTTEIADTLAEFYRIAITAQSVTGGSSYWIRLSVSESSETDYWEVGIKESAGTTKNSSDGSTWASSSFDLYYRITPDDVAPAGLKFFQYMRQQFAIVSGETGAPKLWMNGDMGAADSNSADLTFLNDSTKAWGVDELVGNIVIITGGPGSTETKPWREITANSATALTVDSDWVIAHTTATNYVIVNSDKWTEITGHGLTAPVTDVLIVSNFLYFAQGDSVNIRRSQWYNNSGTATWQYADDGTNKATFLTTVRDDTDGLVVWKANNLDASSLISVAKATVVTSWANMTFGTAIPFRDDNGKITSILEYGSTKLLWIMREGSVFNISSGKPDEIPLKEMHSIMSWQNGQASIVHGVYLYFNLGSGLERYSDGLLSDIGPNRDAGMPAGRQGIVSSMIGYPGRFFVNIDSGTDGISYVLGYNLLGYHEMYRAPVAGQRILSGQIQTIPGNDPDRFWINVGEDFVWLSMPSLTVDPSKDTNSRFVHEGSIETGYMYASLFDIQKLYNSVKIFAENLVEGSVHIEVDYKLDDDTAWTPVDYDFCTSPKDESAISETGVSGNRLKIRLRLMTESASVTPVIKTTVVESISKVPPKYSYSFSYRSQDNDKNLRGEMDEITSAADRNALILTWAKNVTQLKMHSTRKEYDNKKVFIDPPPNQPFKTNSEAYTHRMVVTEIE